MTPAEFHFVTRFTEMARDLTLRNATANCTIETITSAKVSELKMPMFWIQLGLIPLPPILACYLFTKAAKYVGDCINSYRLPHAELRPILQPVPPSTVRSDNRTAAQTDENAQRVERFRRHIDENHSYSVSDTPVIKTCTDSFHKNSPSKARSTDQGGIQGILREGNTASGAAQRRGATESSQAAGANVTSNANGNVVIDLLTESEGSDYEEEEFTESEEDEYR